MSHPEGNQTAWAENRARWPLLILVTLALGWILEPLSGTILWSAIIALLFAPVYRGLLARMQRRRTLAALVTLTIVIVIVIVGVCGNGQRGSAARHRPAVAATHGTQRGRGGQCAQRDADMGRSPGRRCGQYIAQRAHTGEHQKTVDAHRVGTFDVGVQPITDDERIGGADTGDCIAQQRQRRFARDQRGRLRRRRHRGNH